MRSGFVVCPECQAEFKVKEARCPYCGAINEIGAEQQYMRQLEGVRLDLRELGDVSKKEMKKEFRSHIRFTRRVVLVVAILLALVFGIWWAWNSFWESSWEESPEQIKAQLAWEREHFPMLDEWYENGEYEQLRLFEEQLYEDEEEFNLYNWSHSDFLDVYSDYVECLEFAKLVESGAEIPEYEIAHFLYKGMSFRYEVMIQYLDDEEKMTAMSYKNELATFLEDIFGMTEEEIQSLYEKATKKDYFDSGVSAKYADKIKHRFNIRK